MRNGILRDVIFASAGVFMVLAVIGLPRQAAAEHQQWLINQSPCQVMRSPGQAVQLTPCYMPKPPSQAPVRYFSKPSPAPLVKGKG